VAAIPQSDVNERLFYEAFCASPIGIALESMEGKPIFVNPALCSMLGFSEEEMQGKHCMDFSPAEDAEKDWQLFEKLKRGDISDYQLEKRYFRKDGSLMWGRLSVTLLGSHKSQIVMAMVEDITEKKKSEESLRDGEQRMRLAQQAARMGAFDWNIQTGINLWTPELEAIYGLPPGGFAGTQTAFENLIYAEDRERVLGLVDSALKFGKAMRGEWRIVWPDGSLHWIAARWQVFMNESGEPVRMIGVNSDVTERKLGEQALAEMTRKLIDAQEQERARIGRELHDDINQRLAMLAVGLEQLLLDPSDSQSRLPELRDQLVEISSDVQNLSHELHSSKLEYLGVVAGIRSWCREFAERHQVEVEFRSDVRGDLPADVGLCLLRVLQEAVHNSIKHSGVKRTEVQLAGDSNRVHLVISDAGKGFDQETALQGKGLGLTSMSERVRLVNGSITFHSKPMGGTRIHVRIPLSAEASSVRVVGQ
jgi:PAS domain S-box-containing protein